MRYFDKEGVEIRESEWWEKITDPKYPRIDRHVFGTLSVETSWLGIQTQYDERPSLYVLIAKDKDSDTMVVWYDDRSTVAKVKALHYDFCRELGIPLAPERAPR